MIEDFPTLAPDVLERIAFVTAVEVPADAVIVLRSNRPLTLEQAEVLKDQASQVFGERKVVVLPPGIDLDVVAVGNDDG